MFSGIIQGTRKICETEDLPGLRRIGVEMEDLASGLQTGASVAVNGVCLTVVAVENRKARFDIIRETLSRTNLGELSEGDAVNIERALRTGDEIGGHHVTGHIDVCGRVRAVRADENNRELEIACGSEWTRYLVAKGWIAVDGISLTVVDVLDDGFTVCLIPETLDRTLMEKRDGGDAVNLEFDHSSKVIVGTMERMLPELEQRLLKKLQD